MGKNKSKYSSFQMASAVCMIIALLWLTISAPFVYACQQELAKQSKTEQSQSPIAGNEEETANPFGNNTEEKAPSSSSFSEEYLHDQHHDAHFLLLTLSYHKCESASTYVAYHGELLVPPPNVG